MPLVDVVKVAGFLVAALLATAARSAEIARGAMFEVKPAAIWFEEAIGLAQWQRMKQAGDAKALADYERSILAARQAWQFTQPLSVKVLQHDGPGKHLKVEMLTPGRLLGSAWFLDEGAVPASP